MAKARKRTTIADSEPLQWTTDDWMPLTDAFLHIQQVVGGEELAEEDLRRRLVSGDVEAQERLVTPGEGIEIILLAPEDFEDSLLFPRVPPNLNSLHREAHRQNTLLRRIERLRSDGHNFFLRRAGVCRAWPMRPAEPTSPPDVQRSKQLPTERPEGLGPKAWLAAQEVYKLRGEGGKWIDIQHDLLGQIRKRLGGDEWLSKTTLKTALAYLRENGLIDL
jgi:hypothetical protein